MFDTFYENKNAVAFTLFLLGQIVLAVLWAAHLDQRVTELAAKVEILDSVGGRQVHMTLARITNLEHSLDKIGEMLTKLPVFDERITVLKEQLVEMNQQTKAVYKLQSDLSTSVDIDNLPERLKAPMQKLKKEVDEEIKNGK
jgi:hypothetical protein